MNHPHEIDRLAAACEPTLAVITNVGTSHIGLLGSRENIARAKAEVVSGLVDHGELRRTLTLTSANDFTPFIADGFARPAGVDVLMAGSRAEDDVRALGRDTVRRGAAPRSRQAALTAGAARSRSPCPDARWCPTSCWPSP